MGSLGQAVNGGRAVVGVEVEGSTGSLPSYGGPLGAASTAHPAGEAFLLLLPFP